MASQRTHIRVTTSTEQKLRAMAKQRGVPVATVIDELLHEHTQPKTTLTAAPPGTPTSFDVTHVDTKSGAFIKVGKERIDVTRLADPFPSTTKALKNLRQYEPKIDPFESSRCACGHLPTVHRAETKACQAIGCACRQFTRTV